jgi:toxin HigB-1
VIQLFRDDAGEDLFYGRNTKGARNACPKTLWKVLTRKLDALLEQLSGQRRGQHSIRVNDQYRICFTWTDSGPEGVEVTDYHDE